jgi:endonuclease YncB( thermonuclease family)
MPALATVLACLVVAVADGDTLTVRCEVQERQQTTVVRLSQIDAPERRQPWGKRSRQLLGALCFNKPAKLHAEARDRYGRMLGRVECAGTDANAAQVQAGMAWVFDRYVTDRSLYALQVEAREARRGLWADASPEPPWDWRRNIKPPEQVSPGQPAIP